MRGSLPSPPPTTIGELVERKAASMSFSPAKQSQADYAQVVSHLLEFARSCIALAAQEESWEDALRNLDEYSYQRRTARKKARE